LTFSAPHDQQSKTGNYLYQQFYPDRLKLSNRLIQSANKYLAIPSLEDLLSDLRNLLMKTHGQEISTIIFTNFHFQWLSWQNRPEIITKRVQNE
jgi:hypothetical protein